MKTTLGDRGVQTGFRSRGTVGCEVVLALATAIAVFAADDKATVRPAAEARDHIDEKGTYELVVRYTKDVDTHEVYFLDSEEDYHDEKNLALVISYEDAKKFKKLGVNDPSTYYKGKTIRVTGKVIKESSQVRIHVNEPAQIEVVTSSKTPATP